MGAEIGVLLVVALVVTKEYFVEFVIGMRVAVVLVLEEHSVPVVVEAIRVLLEVALMVRGLLAGMELGILEVLVVEIWEGGLVVVRGLQMLEGEVRFALVEVAAGIVAQAVILNQSGRSLSSPIELVDCCHLLAVQRVGK